MNRVYIVHGYLAAPEKHWFPWLGQQLSDIGIECHILAMPNAQTPNAQEWLDYLKHHVVIDEKTIIIGHSLGSIATLNLLAFEYARPLAAIFVSGFYQPVEGLEELMPFSNLYAIAPPCMPFPCYVISALDDPIVPHRYSDELAKHLQAVYIRLPRGGHFLDREGCTEFPPVLKLIKELVNK
ncbi:RBBP9/YdeN family alpha/beta hydrolase [Necropsobacter massiliensis]|uniref:RBBP9/YdeN family alpha/beta hydrolase n=1 Tax=Necropsobacter massiliensis TaxID=1400001 RepID=UPI0005961BF6|nr:alpha/beta hydrolase [Necropsobacter massiliensis]